VSLPVDKEESEDALLPARSHKIIGSGDVKCAIIHLPDIGKFVAEIIDDHRTLNQRVFCYGEEKTQKELWEIARKAKSEVSGGDALKMSPKYESKDQVMEKVTSAEDGSFAQAGAEYFLSLYI